MTMNVSPARVGAMTISADNPSVVFATFRSRAADRACQVNLDPFEQPPPGDRSNATAKNIG